MLKKLFYTGFFVWIFLYILVIIKPELHYHAQQPAFLNTWFFFSQYILYPGGIGKYLSDFIMQGFYYNFFGSIIILIFAGGLSLFLLLVFNKLNIIKNPAFLIFPFSLAIVLFNDYYFPFEILLQAIVIFISVFSLAQLVNLRRYVLPVFLILYVMLYYLFGSGAAIVFSVSCLLVLFQAQSFKDFLINSIAVIVLSVVMPFIAYSFVFNISYNQACFQFLPGVPVTLIYSQSPLLYIFIFLLPILLLINLLLTKTGISRIPLMGKINEVLNSRNGLIGQLMLYGFLLACMLGAISYTGNTHKRNVVLSEFYSFRGNWDKVTEIALSDKEYDFSTNLSYNRAIDKSGKFLDKFFDYPQLLGVSSLFPDNLKTPFYATQISDYYFDINYISKSLQWAHEAKTLEPYNPRILKRLVITNLILGNYKAANTYLNVLSHNPLSSEFVSQYLPYIQDTTKVSNDPDLQVKRALQPLNFTIPLNIKDRLTDLISRDSMNRQAFEHLQVCCLLEHDLGKFMGLFNTSMKFYNQVPAVYEQAVILYLYSSGKNSSRIKISDNTKNQFSYFLKTLKQFGNKPDEAKNSLAGLKNTYIYYVTYLSPKVTNLSVETTKKY